jgi:hypothetical protein
LNQQAALPVDVLEALAAGITSAAPAAERSATLRAGILARARQLGQPDFVTVRTGEGEWRPFTAGVSMKMCHEADGWHSFMLRMNAGATLPAHPHEHEELCLVMSGDARLGDIEMHGGDYHLALPGSDHGVVATRGGCTLFIRTRLAEGAIP